MQSVAGSREYVSFMINDYPASFIPAHSGAPKAPRGARVPVPRSRAAEIWHYETSHSGRSRLAMAALISAAIHAVVFFGVGRAPPKKAHVVADDTPTIQLQMPDLKELDEERPMPSEGDTPVENTSFAPMQPDLPQVALASDFVQQLDVSSLLERPDMSAAKVFVIPENISRGAIRQNLGTIFNLADLDRPPEALVQTPPLYPFQLKREGITATVRVQFIVDSEGRVVNAFVSESSHPGFNESAIQGVNKWKFRAGIKGGRRVNTRMEVPIIFRITDE